MTDAGKANADAAAMAKAAADADAAEKAVAEKAATEKAKAEKAAVEQAAADKGAAVKAAAHVAAREQAAAEQVAAIKAAADKAIVERAAASAAAAPAISGVFSPTLEDGIRAYHDAQYRTAFDIWLQLAEQGDGQAQFHLGALYFEGRGTGKDIAKAREWLQRAQKNGDPRAAGMLSRVNAAAKTAAGTANGAHARGDA
jgi:TPR repeat protein